MNDAQIKLQELTDRVLTLEAIILNTDNDPRFVSKVRSAVIDSEHTSNKPTIINKDGKRYKLEIA